MTPKIANYAHAHASFEKPSSWYVVKLYFGHKLEDKVLCDDWRIAFRHFREFITRAKSH